jgi:hypothetical protein
MLLHDASRALVPWCQHLLQRAPLPRRLTQAETAAEVQRQARLKPLLARLQDTLACCKQLVGEYSEDSGSSAGALGLVKAMFRSGDYQQRFLDVNGDLSTCLTDLQLALNVAGAASQGWLQWVAMAQRRDCSCLAEFCTTVCDCSGGVHHP